MSEFLDERIGASISYGSSYSEEFAVEIIAVAGGAEYPRLIHPFPRRRFRLTCREPLSVMWTEVLNLYFRAYAKYSGFRLQAFDDYTTAPDGRSAPTMSDQALPRLSAGVYQLRKTYGLDKPAISIGRPYRTIFKPVSGTVVVAVNGVLKSSGVAVDLATGQLTLSSPTPSIGDAITAGCQFDYPVRFDSALEVEQSHPAVRMISQLEIVELLKPA